MQTRTMKTCRMIVPAAVILGSLAAGQAVVAQTLAPATSATIAGESVSIGALSLSRQSMQPLPSSAAAPVLPRVFAPTLPRTSYTKYPWKMDIVTTVFWVGEKPTANNPTPNHKSSWDTEWEQRFGGFDDPENRAPEYRPAGFVPKLNPFYVALPYNDCIDYTATKKDAAKIIPWFRQAFKREGQSVCRDRWIAVRHGDRICYAQWSDCGPFLTDDASYVFGDARPANAGNNGAGLDVSPAVRDYLGLRSGGKCDWRFVDVHEIPDGPWKTLGENNHFVQQADRNRELLVSRIEELRRQRDEWFRKNGNADLLRR